MDDPLNDPLPGGGHTSPWFRTPPAAPADEPQPVAYDAPLAYDEAHSFTYDEPQPYSYEEPQPSSYEEPQRALDSFEEPQPQPQPQLQPQPHVHEEPQPQSYEEPESYAEPVDDETVGLRTADTRRAAEGADRADRPEAEESPAPTGEGRAARRKAAQQAARRSVVGVVGGGGGRRRRTPGGTAAAATSETKADGKPLSRVEARRAERARRPSPAVVASRAVGELFISVGVLMLLFVAYQLWWTNVRAGQEAGSATDTLQEDWASGKRKPGAFEPGQGFAIMHIPRLDVVVPVAEGIDKERVLDRGMVGHYAEGALKTAMPDAKKGNFAVAGHRNTHGEPFRYVNRLEKGDEIVVETQDKYYVYSMQTILPQTSPSNTGVIAPIPKGSGFTEPGRYITLTTCTPEFTSTYRMIVWGKMVEERPRSKGKPDALVR
ncbi:class E sortase [Streptomyces sp. B-S-A6]|uniref:Class E sortase n=2 Tax=Streptomyces cavernicola TaxID=3043613 RepID=A0ABT6S3X1_9ACTN|nr:class E sortase [Streptomyces sp. B-S-A6]MDI3402794.1 class E sortase [Streptomyces sp. B-S-A6]